MLLSASASTQLHFSCVSFSRPLTQIVPKTWNLSARFAACENLTGVNISRAASSLLLWRESLHFACQPGITILWKAFTAQQLPTFIKTGSIRNLPPSRAVFW